MKKFAFSFVFCLLLVTSSAWASMDSVDWAQLGPSFTVLSTPQNWTSAGGLTGQVGVFGPFNFERRDQGNGWNGNFNPGDPIIWNQGNPGQFRILFNTLEFGGGAHIQADFFGPFTATVNAYDSGLNLIGTTVMQGDSNANGDGSAIFIDFMSNAQNVFLLDFLVSDINGNDDLAIGNLTIYTGSTTTPEPGTLMLLGSGLVGAIGYGRRRLGL